MSKDKIFVSGIYPRVRTEKTPEWAIGNFGLNVKQLGAWIKENPGLIDDKGFINIQMAVGQSGKAYASVDTWKPKEDSDNVPF